MLTIRADQIDTLTEVTLKRRRREVAAELAEEHPDWDDVALHVDRWFSPLVDSGTTQIVDLLRALTLARHYDRDAKSLANWALRAVLLRTNQEPAARHAFIDKHIMPRLQPGPSSEDAAAPPQPE